MRLNKIIITTPIILGLASASCSIVPTAKEAAILDTVSTAAVLGSGTGVEVNPLSFAGATLSKVLILNNLHRFKPETQDYIKRASATVWTAATVNNLGVLMCVPLSVSLPFILAAGYAVYVNTPVTGEKQFGVVQ
jgi:hypothetical protein